MKAKKNKTSVFNVFMPYGICKIKQTDCWYFFNRQYNPIGLSGDDDHHKQRMESYCGVQIKGLNKKRIADILEKHSKYIKWSDDEQYFRIFFYNDGNKPTKSKVYEHYFNILKEFSNLSFDW